MALPGQCELELPRWLFSQGFTSGICDNNVDSDRGSISVCRSLGAIRTWMGNHRAWLHYGCHYWRKELLLPWWQDVDVLGKCMLPSFLEGMHQGFPQFTQRETFLPSSCLDAVWSLVLPLWSIACTCKKFLVLGLAQISATPTDEAWKMGHSWKLTPTGPGQSYFHLPPSVTVISQTPSHHCI